MSATMNIHDVKTASMAAQAFPGERVMCEERKVCRLLEKNRCELKFVDVHWFINSVC